MADPMTDPAKVRELIERLQFAAGLLTGMNGDTPPSQATLMIQAATTLRDMLEKERDPADAIWTDAPDLSPRIALPAPPKE